VIDTPGIPRSWARTPASGPRRRKTQQRASSPPPRRPPPSRACLASWAGSIEPPGIPPMRLERLAPRDVGAVAHPRSQNTDPASCRIGGGRVEEPGAGSETALAEGAS
jgi:hypothetical protein